MTEKFSAFLRDLETKTKHHQKQETQTALAQWIEQGGACEPKGCWFDSQSGHMPEFQARSPVGGVREATIH